MYVCVYCSTLRWLLLLCIVISVSVSHTPPLNVYSVHSMHESVHCFILSVLVVLSVSYGSKCGSMQNYEPLIRHYCIALLDVDWDYAVASNYSHADLLNMSEDNARAEINGSYPNIGKIFRKGLLREFAYDRSRGFCDWNSAETEDIRDGIMGPTIRAVVGDTIFVHFFNNANTLYDGISVSNNVNYSAPVFNLHPHGLHYDMEGASVSFGEEAVYQWEAHESSGPGDGVQFSSNLWIYHSNIADGADVATGLLGAIVVTDPAYITSEEQRRMAFPCDVDEEVLLLLAETMESDSYYLGWNMLTQHNVSTDPSDLRKDQAVVDALVRRSINGYTYGNLNSKYGLNIPGNSKVRWLVVSSTVNTATEAVKWDGHTVVNADGTESSSFSISSTGYSIADMMTDAPGSWLVAPTEESLRMRGMAAEYSVYEYGSSKKSVHQSKGLGNDMVAVIAVCVSVVALTGLVILVFKVKSGVRPLWWSEYVPCVSSMDDSQVTIELNTSESNAHLDSISSEGVTIDLKPAVQTI